jgi:quinol monooxygenase YgiN
MLQTRTRLLKAFLRRNSVMAANTVHLTVDLVINEGKLEAFEDIARSMVAGSQKEPGTIGYEWFLSTDRKRCRLLETYTDAKGVLAHFNGPVVQELVPKLLGTARLADFEVYGDPGPKATEMLAGFGAEIFEFRQGLDR